MRLKSSKIFNIFLAVSLILFPYARTEGMQSSNYIIDKDSINFGGTDESESANYKLSDTMGEIGTGESQAKCSSLNFDGTDDYIDAGNDASLNLTGDMTVSAWIKPDTSQSLVSIVSGGDTDSGKSFELRLGSLVPYMILGDGTSFVSTVSFPAIPTGSFSHIVGTVSGNSIMIYVDGELKDTANFSGIRQSLTRLVIGRFRVSDNIRSFDGSIEDTRIYNRALSSTEISDLYNGKQIDSTGLKGQWGFNEGSGTATADLSGNGNNGTIYNATFSTDTPSVTCNILNAGYRQEDAVASTISISSPDNVILGPSIGGILGGSGTGSAAWTVTTNDPAGYQVSIKSSTTPALVFSSYSFADYIPGAGIPDYSWTLASSASEFGYSVEGAHTVSKFLDNGSICAEGSGNVPDKCWLGFSTSDESVATSALPNNPAGTATTIKFRAEAGSQRMQQDGSYVATIIVTAVAL